MISDTLYSLESSSESRVAESNNAECSGSVQLHRNCYHIHVWSVSNAISACCCEFVFIITFIWESNGHHFNRLVS